MSTTHTYGIIGGWSLCVGWNDDQINGIQRGGVHASSPKTGGVNGGKEGEI